MFQKSLSLPAIAAQLRKLCQEKKTGTLLIMNNGHILGQISLEKGDIVSLMAGKQHGINVLQIFLELEIGDIAFTSSPLSTPRMSLPSTTEILAILERVETTTASSLLSAQGSHPSLTAASKTILEQTLKEFIGPIATMICTDHFRVANTLAATIDALANDIPSSQAAAQFRERVRQRLGS